MVKITATTQAQPTATPVAKEPAAKPALEMNQIHHLEPYLPNPSHNPHFVQIQNSCDATSSKDSSKGSSNNKSNAGSNSGVGNSDGVDNGANAAAASEPEDDSEKIRQCAAALTKKQLNFILNNRNYINLKGNYKEEALAILLRPNMFDTFKVDFSDQSFSFAGVNFQKAIVGGIQDALYDFFDELAEKFTTLNFDGRLIATENYVDDFMKQILPRVKLILDHSDLRELVIDKRDPNMDAEDYAIPFDRLYCIGANLQAQDLSNLYLFDATFERANLLNANFSNSDLTRVAFSCSKAREADFNNAQLRAMELQGAELTGSNFIDADLSAASFAFNEHNDDDRSFVDLQNSIFIKSTFAPVTVGNFALSNLHPVAEEFKNTIFMDLDLSSMGHWFPENTEAFKGAYYYNLQLPEDVNHDDLGMINIATVPDKSISLEGRRMNIATLKYLMETEFTNKTLASKFDFTTLDEFSFGPQITKLKSEDFPYVYKLVQANPDLYQIFDYSEFSDKQSNQMMTLIRQSRAGGYEAMSREERYRARFID